MEKSVYLDPGHGGTDPGAVGPRGSREADINLAVALRIGEELGRNEKIRVSFTRTEDASISLRDRVAKANSAGAEIFVSVHCNAAKNPEARGTEIYHYAGSQQGKALAKAIHGPLIRAVELEDRGVRKARFYVLRYTRMPAVLIELAFISNEREEALLRDNAFQAKAAKAIAEGIAGYLG